MQNKIPFAVIAVKGCAYADIINSGFHGAIVTNTGNIAIAWGIIRPLRGRIMVVRIPLEDVILVRVQVSQPRKIRS